MAINLSALKIGKTIKKYWTDEETYIFKNYIDAIFGAIVLIIIPGVSLLTIVFITTPSWANYTFPLLSICLAGLYDTYGRYESGAAKNTKLALRATIDVLAIFLAVFLANSNCRFLWMLPALMLLLCGVTLIAEVFLRVKLAIAISKWAVRGEEDSINV